MVPPRTTAAYTPTLTWLCWAAVRRMPGSLERAPCARVVITQRPHGPVMFRRTAAPVAAVHAASSEAYGVRIPSEGRVREGEVGITELEERARIRPGRVEG